MSGVSIPRLREPEARILVLRILAMFASGQAETAQVKEMVPLFREFGPPDLRPSDKYKNEYMWQQIVGNVLSERGTGISIFDEGWAVRLAKEKSIRITDAGRAHLKKIGY
jgi:hypothetical protein